MRNRMSEGLQLSNQDHSGGIRVSSMVAVES